MSPPPSIFVTVEVFFSATEFKSLLLDVYVWLNMFLALFRPSSAAYNCISSLWFYHRSVAVNPDSANEVESS
jgi:hypothetical protein